MSRHVIAYYPAWAIYGKNYQPEDIPFEKLTHLNYGNLSLYVLTVPLTGNKL
jgi:GH18 family chitinase